MKNQHCSLSPFAYAKSTLNAFGKPDNAHPTVMLVLFQHLILFKTEILPRLKSFCLKSLYLKSLCLFVSSLFVSRLFVFLSLCLFISSLFVSLSLCLFISLSF
jgi:hypothetical protein